jgi:tetratricopeptide (TPR) repeat protein
MKKYLPIALAVMILFTIACNPFGGGKSDAEKAADLLSAGLQAHGVGNYDEATKDYRAVLALDPNNAFAYYNLGQIDQVSGRPEAAENNYRLALSINPDFPSALFNLAIIRNSAGDTTEAETLYRHVIQVDPQNAGAHFNLGLLLRFLGQTTEGDQLVAQGIQLDATLKDPATPAPSSAPIPAPTGPTPTR